MATLPPDDDILARRRRLLGPAYRLFYERPLHLVRGQGVWLYDADGRRYLDAYNNVASVGHAHPAVVAALSRQAATLNTHTRYLHDTVLSYAERLLATLPGMASAMFTCTGSEANDLALRIACAATGGTAFIVTANAYHGGTVATARLSPSLAPLDPADATVATVAPPLGDTVASSARFTADVADIIEALRIRSVRLAGLILDTVLSSDGIRTHPVGFPGEAAALVRAAGGLVIADEVQAGFARTGEAMWGYGRHGLAPDLVTMGKPMGNGHPLAGVAAREGVLDAFAAKNRYFNTFGGNPVSAAIGLAVLDVIEAEDLQRNALAVGQGLRAACETLAGRHPVLREVRGVGLCLGLDLRDPETGLAAPERARRVVNGLRDDGVLVSTTGADSNVLKIRPPLVFSEENAAQLVESLDRSLSRSGAA